MYFPISVLCRFMQTEKDDGDENRFVVDCRAGSHQASIDVNCGSSLGDFCWRLCRGEALFS